MAKNLYISAGHYGYSSGAVAGGYNEADLNQRFLDAIDFGIKVPTGSLRSKIDWVNERATPDDIAIEIHCNYSSYASKNGTEVYYRDEDDRQLALKLDTELTKVFGITMGAVSLDELHHLPCDPHLGSVHHDSESYVQSLGWCRELKCPAVIVEVGYMSNPYELAFILKSDTPEKLADAIRATWNPAPPVSPLPPAPACVEEKEQIGRLQQLVKDLISLFKNLTK